jgi:adenylate kinase
MAPITETVVDDLKSTVHRLEKRIAELESRLSGHGGGAHASEESVRMILMGPPGAGMLHSYRASKSGILLTLKSGKGTQAPRIKEKFCACHLVRFSGFVQS